MSVPTLEHIKEFVTDREHTYGKQREMIVRNRELRFRDHVVNVPSAYKNTTVVVKSPIIADIDSRVVAMLTKEFPGVSVPPYADTQIARDNASLRERWSQSALHQMEREANRPIFRMGIDGAAADSLRIWKLVDRADVWRNLPRIRDEERYDDNLSPDENKKRAAAYEDRKDKFVKGQPFPFVWSDIDPLTYFPDSYSGIPTEVAEVSVRALIPTLEMFGYKRNGSNMAAKFSKRRTGEPVSENESKDDKTVKCVEHWRMSGDGKSATVSYVLDDELLENEQRTLADYPRLPFFPIGGHMTSSRDPRHQYASVTEPFAELVPALDAMMTMAMNRMALFGYPFMRRRNANGQTQMMGPEDPTGVTTIQPGEILEDIEFMGEIGPSAVIKDMVNLFMQMIDRSGLSPIMYGGGGGATPSSGYLAGQLMTAAQIVFGPIVDNAILALSAMVPFMWQLVERRPTLKRKVYVWGAGAGEGKSEWLGLGPEDIDGYYACEIKLKPLLPMDKFAERQSAIQMKDAGLWSDTEALSQTGNEQPEDMLMDVTARRAATSPPVMDELLKRAIAEKFPPPPAPPAPPPPPMILGANGMPMPPQNVGQQTMPGGMPGGGQFQPQLPDLTRPPQMGLQVGVPTGPPQQG